MVHETLAEGVIHLKPTIIYLDQNKWIDLGRAYYKREGGEKYRATLERAQSSVKKGKAIFPLSAEHLIETSKMANLDRRKRLARVMVDLSEGQTLAAASDLVAIELRAGLATIFEQPPVTPPPPVTALGRGFPFAFGRSLSRDLGISEDEAKKLEEALGTEAGMFLNLVGDDETATAKAVEGITHIADSYVQEAERVRALARGYSKAIGRRAHFARLTLQLEAELSRALRTYNKSIDDFLDLGEHKLMAFFSRLPTVDVKIELDTQRDDHSDRRVYGNDMFDISFLTVAIPYCDIVVTEKFWTDLIKRKKLDKKYSTIVLSDVSELEHQLDASV